MRQSAPTTWDSYSNRLRTIETASPNFSYTSLLIDIIMASLTVYINPQSIDHQSRLNEKLVGYSEVATKLWLQLRPIPRIFQKKLERWSADAETNSWEMALRFSLSAVLVAVQYQQAAQSRPANRSSQVCFQPTQGRVQPWLMASPAGTSSNTRSVSLMLFVSSDALLCPPPGANHFSKWRGTCPPSLMVPAPLDHTTLELGLRSARSIMSHISDL